MKLRSLALAALVVGAAGIGAFAWATAPARSAAESWQGLGEPDVAPMAELVDALVLHASRRATGADRDTTLRQLRRLIGGYLGLPGAP